MFLNQWGPCLVDAGGDVVAGDAPADHPGWPVALTAPSSVDAGEPEDVMVLWLNNGALATSGVDYHHWTQDGRPRHHIIDPRTGVPALTDVVTATVLSADAMRAEAWAKATLIAGVDDGMKMLAGETLPGVLVNTAGHWRASRTLLPFVATANDPTLGEANYV